MDIVAAVVSAVAYEPVDALLVPGTDYAAALWRGLVDVDRHSVRVESAEPITCPTLESSVAP